MGLFGGELMKEIIFSVLFCLISVPVYADISTGLVGWWKFDGGISGSITNGTTTGLTDSSGQGDNGTANNANGTGMAWIQGKIQGAVSFDGVDDYVLTGSVLIDQDTVTMCAWVNPTATTLGSVILSTGSTRLFMANNGSPIWGVTSDNWNTVAKTTATISTGVWQHICGVRNSDGTATLYVNGVISGAANQSSGTPGTGGHNMQIGRNPISGYYPLNGSIDDVRIYNRALSAADIAQLYSYNASSGMGTGNISAVWANSGEDKVTQDELRVGNPNGRKVLNRLWDGTKIILSGAKNEVVDFNMILEASTQTATGVSVSFNTLTGPGGVTINSIPTSGNGVFNWVNRPIELFYVRYLQIKGLSVLSYSLYDERHVPLRMRRPWTGEGIAVPGTTWQDRPDHDKFYPDIAVPLELVPSFNIAAGKNQAIWSDIYIPKNVPAGVYQGNVTITEGANIKTVPVELTVYNFALPDKPSAKTMVAYGGENVNNRFFGQSWITGANTSKAKAIQDRYFFLAHRHKISLIGDDSFISGDMDNTVDHPSPNFAARLQDSFFTAANGYDGPGVNVGNGVYSVGTYGEWYLYGNKWGDTQAHVWQHSDAWVNWFDQNAPGVEYFLYLIDESTNYPQIEQWSQWLKNNPGPGSRLKSFATIPLPIAVVNTPTLEMPASVFWNGTSADWEAPALQYSNDPVKRFYMYNGRRPGSGSSAIEDDGVAMRELAWGQYKKHINRWFYWEATYYNDFQDGGGIVDLFNSAHTFGSISGTDGIVGETGFNYSTGDGVLLYPGTDKLFPGSSYGVDGPFASLRLKYWRRGLQDYDYLTLAQQIDPAAVQAIVSSMVPKVLWEYGVSSLSDPTWVRTDISWPTDPDAWESARVQLASIIATKAISATLYGDVNEDSSVTIADAELVAQSFMGLKTLSTAQQTEAEVDGKNSVDIYDAFLIAEYAAGLISKFPVQNN
jgi:hypothetical protein